MYPNKILLHIENIKIQSVKRDLKLIHQMLSEINSAKLNSQGVSFENKINRLKAENAAEYEKFRRSTIPAILETTKQIDEFFEIISKSQVNISKNIKKYLEENQMELESDLKIIKKYYFDRNISFLK